MAIKYTAKPVYSIGNPIIGMVDDINKPIYDAEMNCIGYEQKEDVIGHEQGELIRHEHPTMAERFAMELSPGDTIYFKVEVLKKNAGARTIVHDAEYELDNKVIPQNSVARITIYANVVNDVPAKE